MGSILNVTPLQPVKVTASGAVQNLWDALDVAEFDILDLELGVVQFNATTITVSIITSMQNEIEDDSWITAFSFDAVTSGPSYKLKTQSLGFFRYIRWKVTGFTGTDAHFWIRGIGRKYGA